MRKKAIFMMVVLFTTTLTLFTMTGFSTGTPGNCSAVAAYCPSEVSCVAVPPEGGSTRCYSDPFMAVCFVYDENGNTINSYQNQCSECI